VRLLALGGGGPLVPIGKGNVDGPYNKDPTVKTSGSRGVYNKLHAQFLY
jgi:hypothetical protein